ncbi:ser/threonine protein phosphatase [Halomonas cupida]|uniref:Ser/threonine protein phosphatase n=1 Tax=Halomonas cupida TaxID=44933 RepID=A0A1M7CLG4_9GAMM|nr:phosphatase PAP2/dual specificity phosphatase family protein [Halomonas cupida]GEN26158.1 ser/threonine protein phosphatase [Halomonas cupida]SHL67659.1 Predicted protein-tyrosine phosphatase [Halomonas cupida]
MAAIPAEPTPRPWRLALAWLVALGIFFYASYGLANWLATQRAHVPSVVFDWEANIPFVAWSILPYWSLNLFYTGSLFVCSTRHELGIHVRRLLTVQIIAVTFFIITPLAFSFGQPEVDGLPGRLFGALRSFDRPYNQAPSLHIALVVILWSLYSHHVQGLLRGLLHLWFILVGLSVLTTWQHHFIDVPTGALLGLFCLWLWPLHSVSPLKSLQLSRDRRRIRLFGYYTVGAVLLAAMAMLCGGAWLWLWYPAVSLALVAANYLVIGINGFQKDPQGIMTLAARLLLLPYLLGAWLNSRWWTRGQTEACEIVDGVWLGRFPTAHSLNSRVAPVVELSERELTVLDLTAELPAPGNLADTGVSWFCQPMLDLVDAPPSDLAAAATRLELKHKQGPVLVVCALGYSRSASVVALWLVQSGRATSIDTAIAMIAEKRPSIRLDERHRQLIKTALQKDNGQDGNREAT